MSNRYRLRLSVRERPPIMLGPRCEVRDQVVLQRLDLGIGLVVSRAPADQKSIGICELEDPDPAPVVVGGSGSGAPKLL